MGFPFIVGPDTKMLNSDKTTSLLFPLSVCLSVCPVLKDYFVRPTHQKHGMALNISNLSHT